VQHPSFGAVSTGRNHDVAGWKAVVTDARQSFLGAYGKRFGLAIDHDPRQQQKVFNRLRMIVTRTGGVTNLQQKREAHGDICLFNQAGESLAYELVMTPRPG
jgi:hypothetical protein